MLADAAAVLPGRRWVAVWVCGFLILLLVLAPASLMGWCLRQLTEGRIGIAAPAGSFWNGSGYLAALHEGGDAPIRWQLQPYRLLLGQLRIELGQGTSTEGSVTYSPGELRVSKLDLSFPASVLGQALAPLNSARLGGIFRLRSDVLLLSGNEAAGALRASLENASSGLIASSALGSYELTAAGADRKLAFELKTVSGPLSVAGSGAWSWGQNPTFTGTMSAAPGKQSELSPILSIGGAPNSAGSVDLAWPPRR